MIALLTLIATLVASPAQSDAHGHAAHVTQLAQTPPSPLPATTTSALPSLAPSATSSSATVAPSTPTPTPLTYKYRFVPHNTSRLGEPKIYAVYLNDKKLRSLGPINIKVATTPDVVKVVSRSNGREGIIPIVTPGNFEATSMLPKIPFIAAGMTLEIEFIATTATGRSTIVRVPVLLN